MGVETTHNVIRSRFSTMVEAVENVLTTYDNGPDPHEDNTMWVRWSVKPLRARAAEAGGASFRNEGSAIAQIFQPIHQGDQAALALADVVVTAFRAVTDSGVVFKVPVVTVPGRTGKWWQVVVTCPFQCTEIP